jgi:hypothetical protein
MNTPLDGFQRLLAVLDRLELSYYISGSVASSFYGLARFTNDVDFVVAIVLDDVDQFARELQSSEFYAEPKMMREAIQLHRSFNVIHMPSAISSISFRFRTMPSAAPSWLDDDLIQSNSRTNSLNAPSLPQRTLS